MFTQNKKCSNECKDNSLYAVFLIFVFFIVIATGSLVAYFSDIITQDGSATAGTLDIQGTYNFYLNGNETALSDLTIENFNPGDVLVAKATIENVGNKSAWIRNIINFTGTSAEIQPYIKIYEGEETLATISEGATELSITGSIYTSDPKIIDGNSDDENRETETGSNALLSDSMDVAYTIYFDTLAGNDTQGKNISFTVSTQAIQYRNNTAVPTDSIWGSVVTTPFSYTP